MEFVDTHAHFQSLGISEGGERSTHDMWAKAPELTTQQLLKDAQAADVRRFMLVGCDLADSQLAIQAAQAHADAGCWASIGIHPHEAAKALADPRVLPSFGELASQPRVKAVGECGLDYFYKHSPKADQLEVLKFQLTVARRAGLPLIFHVREALDDFWPLFDTFGSGELRGVLHSFTDSRQNLDKALERGLYIGVNGIATFAKAPEQLEMYQAIPLERMVLETDAPFLTPTPFRGRINESKYIKRIAEFLAELRGDDLAHVAEVTTNNARELFDI